MLFDEISDDENLFGDDQDDLVDAPLETHPSTLLKDARNIDIICTWWFEQNCTNC